MRNDSVVFAKGYGVRVFGKPEPVTPHTMFAIGSNTKLFTAVSAGIAVDDGKLNLTASVITYLPWFQPRCPCALRGRLAGGDGRRKRKAKCRTHHLSRECPGISA